MVSQSDEQIVGADQHARQSQTGHISFASTKMSLSAEVMDGKARAPTTIGQSATLLQISTILAFSA